MSGDYSRFTDRPKRRYSGVLMQQGRVQLDADWNEHVDIGQRRWETQAEDTFGTSAVPRATTPDGFKIGAPAGGDFAIGAGRIYVDGKLAELFPGEKVGAPPGVAVSYLHQPFYPDPPPLPAGATTVFLDVWDREVTYVEDPDILEKALGGPDTATRRQTVWQVRTAAASGGAGTPVCGAPLPAPSGGRLSTRAVAPPPSDDPCDLAPSGGYRGLENRLYRLEVHTGGNLAAARFKWSRDNASVVSAVTAIGGSATASALTVTRIGRDAVLRFAKDDWVEVTDDVRELMGEPGEMAKVALVDEASRVITLDRKIPAAGGRAFGATAQDLADRHTRLRLWNQTLGVDANGLLAQTVGTWISLEDGVEVQLFQPGADPLLTGDYWVFAARAVDGSVETLDQAEPVGIRHHYSQLAAIDASGGIQDCRSLWPAACGCCAVTVSPGDGWEQVFNQIQPGQDASICFEPGIYRLHETIALSRRGHLKIEGAGAGTRILANGLECAFRFQDCKSVVVRDLAAETGLARSGKGQPVQHLNGTLTFAACGPVTVEAATLQCGSGDRRAASCITIAWPDPEVLAGRGQLLERTPAPSGTAGVPVRIRDCNLTVGRGQIGILVVNGQQVQIEGNDIAVAAPGRKAKFARLLRGSSFRRALRRHLISNAQVVPRGQKAVADLVTLQVAEQRVSFKTAPALRDAWAPLLKDNPPDSPVSQREAVQHLYRLAADVLLGHVKDQPLFLNYLSTLRQDIRPVASQGIVVGGRSAGDVRILNNSVNGTLQGVHVGLSHGDPSRRDPADVAGRVLIAGNRVVVLLAAGTRGERHGIFVGSVDSAIVEDNYVLTVRFATTEGMNIDGIRVWGQLGALLLIQRNHLADCDTGVRVEPLNPADGRLSLWSVDQNVRVNGIKTVDAPKVVARSRNKPS